MTAPLITLNDGTAIPSSDHRGLPKRAADRARLPILTCRAPNSNVVTKLPDAGRWRCRNVPRTTAIAGARGTTPAQVLITWHIQLSNIVIPRSVNPRRIASSFDVFDYERRADETASTSSLDDGPGRVRIHEPSISQVGE
jgi:hypothetical protein